MRGLKPKQQHMSYASRRYRNTMAIRFFPVPFYHPLPNPLLRRFSLSLLLVTSIHLITSIDMSFAAPQPQMSTKHRQIAQLSQQLALLAERTEQLERLTQTTAEQAKFMRSLGGNHAGW